MKQDYRQLLKPEIINTVSGMALISRVIVDGYLNGINHSRRVGAGMEFSQFRGYEPGDDLRLLDWKMLARSGRYYIKHSSTLFNLPHALSCRICTLNCAIVEVLFNCLHVTTTSQPL